MSIKLKAIRIVLEAFDTKCLDLAVSQLISLAKQQRTGYQGPIPLPVKIRRYTVNRSPHIDKTSREQFESKTYRRVLIVNPTVEFTSAIVQVSLPTSVRVKIGYPNNERKAKGGML